MSKVRIRFGGFLTIGCVVALMVAGATPAFAHHSNDHAQGEAASEGDRFADDDDNESSDERGSSSEKSQRKDADSDTTTTSDSQTTTASDDGTPDGAGKNYDREGEPRGETSTQCESNKSEVNNGDVYDNTCDGRAGKAGSGGGSAQGRPCAGCVGNADDKNPQGQMNDGDHDGNAGYECDGNNGVARDNPAHTGCPEPPTGSSTPMCPTMPSVPLNHPDCDEVEGRTDTSGPVVGPRVLPNVIRNVAPAEQKAPAAILPFTGAGSVLPLLVTAAIMIGSGVLALRTRRK